jgi:hypothetical protein
VELQHVADMRQKSELQKVAMRPNGWLCKVILPAKGLILSNSFYLGTILIQFPPSKNVTPDFQKGGKKEKNSKLSIFSTDCSQSMGLQSVLKIRAKTLKLFALQASPCKGSKPRADLDAFIFSRSIF